MKKEYTLSHEGIDTEFFKSAGSVWIKQRQIASVPPTKEKPKIEWLQDFLEDTPERVVVFCWYKATVQEVVDTLRSQRSLDREVLVYTGDATPRQRETALSEWKSTEGAIVVATISSLGEGVNLTEGNTVVFLEHSTLPEENNQAIARLKRRGQERTTYVHNVYAQGTVDEAIREVIEGRAQSIAQAIQEWMYI